jgi:hypothetical protein
MSKPKDPKNSETSVVVLEEDLNISTTPFVPNETSVVHRNLIHNSSTTNTSASKIQKKFGTPGPFQVIDSPQSNDSERSELDHPAVGPRRRYDCSNYETCLNLAAAVNWDSFTCRGCCGEVNPKLLWRAQHEITKDRMAKIICELPDPKSRRIEKSNPIVNLKLVSNKN